MYFIFNATDTFINGGRFYSKTNEMIIRNLIIIIIIKKKKRLRNQK